MSVYSLAEHVGQLLMNKRLMLATAESCTGGWIAKSITDIAGSSSWYERGFVTYSNASKIEMLSVSAASLQRYGAVSEQVVDEMAMGALRHSAADMSVAVSGIAGPSGGSAEKPVGMVWFAWAFTNCSPVCECRQFQGDREAVRHKTVEHALQKCIEMLSSAYV